ncbi:WXG100 family type VII secretion target [Paractinoplanes lichenicola]|uniref:WXG100 family type VII secretion target n=1 Tax=Paractinoplanes lichenicola TaxID=2802976 RepID=A0ABS1W1H5_9ACTN|nr:WXG100 family type VII secretion target [Actinoplanes lichenicola]MBL7260588.1 WXG100 family type VII secretion target [Actinoplanes lichenicola]
MTSPVIASAPSPWAGVWIAEDIELIASGVRDGSWVDGTLGVVGGGLDALALATDPAGALLQYGIAWLIEHVKPLSEALDWLAGDPEQIAAHARSWQHVAASLSSEAQTLARTTEAELAGWSGAAAEAYRTWSAGHAQTLQTLARAADTMAAMTEGAGALIGTVRLMVRDAVATVVSRLIVYAAELIATAGLATPVVVGQVSALCASWAARIAGWLRDLLASLRRLLTESDRLGKLIEALKRLLPDSSGGGSGAGSRATGGEIRRPRNEFDFEVTWAEQSYERIRAATGDVAEVATTASRYGFSEADVRQVKSHVFLEDHVLDLYDGEPAEIARFGSNPRIAEAWERLRTGNPHPEDIVWLNHERYEAQYMIDTGDPSYRRAHNATLEAGYEWHPEAAAADGFGYQRQ